MNPFKLKLDAARRVSARQNYRNLRTEAYQRFKQGEQIPLNLIESNERIYNRGQFLNLEALTTNANPNPQKIYEAVIGRDDTLPRRFLLEGDQAAQAVGRVIVQQTQGGLLFGTGSLVAPQLLMTNHHILSTPQDAMNAVFELSYYEQEENTPAANRQGFYLDPNLFFYTSQALDYTLVGVIDHTNNQQLSTYGYLPLFANSGKALIGERVNIIHHPGGRYQSISIRANEVVDVFDTWIHYAADTEPGSSGAAVFNDEWQLVALHHAAVPTDTGVINEGIRISAILDDLLNS